MINQYKLAIIKYLVSMLETKLSILILFQVIHNMITQNIFFIKKLL